MDAVSHLRHGFTVLLAEDEEDDVLLVQKSFEKAGVMNPVQVVIDGQEAIDYLAGAGQFADRGRYPLPGLVILDLNLPRKTGFEVLQWIRGQRPLMTLPVLCSSTGQPEEVRTAYKLGANGFVKKPSDFQKLVALAEAIKRYWLLENQSPFSGTLSVFD